MTEQVVDWTSWQVSAISSLFFPFSFAFEHFKYHVFRLSVIQIFCGIQYAVNAKYTTVILR